MEIGELLQKLADHGMDLLCARLSKNSLRPGRPTGTHRDMDCRVFGCGRRSRGPRFRYMCPVHSYLPAREQLAALRRYREGRPKK